MNFQLSVSDNHTQLIQTKKMQPNKKFSSQILAELHNPLSNILPYTLKQNINKHNDMLNNKINTYIKTLNALNLKPIIKSSEYETNKQIKSILPNNLYILEEYQGHQSQAGHKIGNWYNPALLVVSSSNNNLNKDSDCYVLMFVEPNNLVKISYNVYKYITNENNYNKTWYLNSNGYVATTYSENGQKIQIYLHQFIINKFNPLNTIKKEKDNLSVDHINRDKLDNRLCNLRWADQSVQNENRDKVNRHKNAQELPENIGPLPKYVTYNKEIYDKINGSIREFFRIEGHPLLPIVWSSSKSNKVSISDKYNETLNRLNELSQGKIIVESKYIYPVGIRHNQDKNVFLLDWRDKNNNERYNMKMSIDKTLSIDTNYKLFVKKIKDKYPNLTFN